MILFYVRHGDPIYDPDQLTPLGQRQAEAVGRRLARFGIDQIYSSTSTRAYQTSLPTAEMMKKPVEQMEFCHENLAWKDLAIDLETGGKTWAFYHPEVSRLFATKSVRDLGEKWYEHPELKKYNFHPAIQRIHDEADKFLASLGYEHDRENGNYRIVRPNHDRVALFAHQGFGLAFLSSILDIPYPLFSMHFDMSHTGMSVIDFTEKEDGVVVPRALTVGNDGHLLADNMPTAYHNLIRF